MAKERETTVEARRRFGAWITDNMVKTEGGALSYDFLVGEGSAYMGCSVSQVRNFLAVLTGQADPVFKWQIKKAPGSRRKVKYLVEA